MPHTTAESMKSLFVNADETTPGRQREPGGGNVGYFSTWYNQKEDLEHERPFLHRDFIKKKLTGAFVSVRQTGFVCGREIQQQEE